MTPSGEEPAHPSPLHAWISVTRPRTLLAGAVPVIVGAALAASMGRMAWGPALGALACALLIQVGTNLANDLFDFRAGADTAERVGPARATQRGWLTQRQVVGGTAVALGGAALLGVYLVAVGGWPIAVIGVTSLVLAVAYTGGPFPLAYHGLGDLFVLLFFGFVAVGGTTWVVAGALPPEALVAGGAIGCLATAILVVNNLRDRHTDGVAGKRTLAVRFGSTATRWEYTLLVVVAYLAVGVAPVFGLGGPAWLLAWLSTPLAIREVRAIWTTDGAALNPHLGGAARVELAFGLLLSAGILIGS